MILHATTTSTRRMRAASRLIFILVRQDSSSSLQHIFESVALYAQKNTLTKFNFDAFLAGRFHHTRYIVNLFFFASDALHPRVYVVPVACDVGRGACDVLPYQMNVFTLSVVQSLLQRAQPSAHLMRTIFARRIAI